MLRNLQKISHPRHKVQSLFYHLFKSDFQSSTILFFSQNAQNAFYELNK